jgi:hypothetical protein
MSANGVTKEPEYLQISLFRRALWHANRTRFAWMLKGMLSALHTSEKALRRREAKAYLHDSTALAHARVLREQGYAIITDLVDPHLLAQLDSASRDRVARADELERTQLLKHKAFWVRLLDADSQDGAFDCDNVFVRYALQPRVIAVLAGYLGELPRLTDVLLTLSRHSSAPLSYSQLWHKDYDDVHTLKVFVYLTDVLDTADGPFTFMPGKYSDRVGFTLHSHLTDEELFRRTASAAVKEVKGPRLTTFVCETSRCMHMGSRVLPDHRRLMYTASFISAPSLYPVRKKRFRSARPLPARERLLLGL